MMNITLLQRGILIQLTWMMKSDTCQRNQLSLSLNFLPIHKNHRTTARSKRSHQRQPQRTILPARNHRSSRNSSPQCRRPSWSVGPFPPRALAQKVRMRSHPVPASQTRNHPTSTHGIRCPRSSFRRWTVPHCRRRGIAERGPLHHVQR